MQLVMDVYLQYLIHLELTDLLNIRQLLLLFHILLKQQYYLIHGVDTVDYLYRFRLCLLLLMYYHQMLD